MANVIQMEDNLEIGFLYAFNGKMVWVNQQAFQPLHVKY